MSTEPSTPNFNTGNPSPKTIENRQFWSWYEFECGKLKKRFKYMDAERVKEGANAGLWRIINRADLSDHTGETAFTDLAVKACERIGYRASGRQDALQYWCSHIFGDHMIEMKLPDVNPNEVDLFTEYNDADMTREMHLGRYKQGGEWRDTDSAGMGKDTAALPEIPSVIVPVVEP
jgi:hypothetical protein